MLAAAACQPVAGSRCEKVGGHRLTEPPARSACAQYDCRKFGLNLLWCCCFCVQSAQREIALWFKAEELASYEPTTCAWVYE